MQKQWSKIKKRLEDSICDKLKGRVTFFAASYRGAHDGQGRVCVLVDKKEIVNMSFTNNGEWYAEYYKVREEGYEGKALIGRTNRNLAKRGLFTTNLFAEAWDEFCTKSVEELLSSDNAISRMIALIDRRTGYRTLVKRKDEMSAAPEWLKIFYDLRMSIYHDE